MDILTHKYMLRLSGAEMQQFLSDLDYQRTVLDTACTVMMQTGHDIRVEGPGRLLGVYVIGLGWHSND